MRQKTSRLSTRLLAALLLGLLATLPSHGQALGWQWVTQTVRPGMTENGTSVVAVAVDAAGTTVVAGSFQGTVTFGAFTLTSEGPADVFVGWLDSTGRYRRVVRGQGPGAASANRLALGADGTVTITGSFAGASARFGAITIANSEISGSPVAFDVFVARLDSTGRWLAATAVGSPGYEYLTGLALDAAGNAVVTGYFTGPVCRFGPTTLVNASVGYDSFVARLDQAGRWTQAVRLGGPDNDLAQDVALEADGTAVITGFFNSAALQLGPFTLLNDGTPYYGLRGSDIFVARLNPAGLWTQAARAGGASNDSADNVVLDAQGNAVIAGYFQSPALSFGRFDLTNATPAGEVTDVFVARLSRAGAWTQAAQSSGTGSEDAAFRKILALDAQGNAVITGTFRDGTARFGNWLLPTPTPSFDRDIFVAWLDTAGTWTRALAVGGYDYDGVPTLALHNGALTLAGESWNPHLAFGTLNTTQRGSFVARYDKTRPVRPPVAVTVAEMVVPNVITPNGDGQNDKFRFRNAGAGPWALHVYNRWGRQVYDDGQYQQDWDAAGLPAGLYYYLLQPANGTARKGWLEVVR